MSCEISLCQYTFGHICIFPSTLSQGTRHNPQLCRLTSCLCCTYSIRRASSRVSLAVFSATRST